MIHGYFQRVWWISSLLFFLFVDFHMFYTISSKTLKICCAPYAAFFIQLCAKRWQICGASWHLQDVMRILTSVGVKKQGRNWYIVISGGTIMEHLVKIFTLAETSTDTFAELTETPCIWKICLEVTRSFIYLLRILISVKISVDCSVIVQSIIRREDFWNLVLSNMKCSLM